MESGNVNAPPPRDWPETMLRFCPSSPFNAHVRAAVRFASQLVAWFHKNKRALPWRRTRDPYAIWVSEVMLQQTGVKTAIPYWERWMAELPTLAALANAKPDRVLKLWEGLGYYSRARNLHNAAQKIMREHAGGFPKNFEEILALPGIGRYTAGAIGSIAFGLPTPIVDGNVVRVLARYFGLRGDPKSKTTNAALWAAATKGVQAADEFSAAGAFNEAMMELGATICLPREPKCVQCPIAQKCYACQNGQTGKFPELPPRAASETKVFRAALIRSEVRIALRQRPAGSVNAGFWELPNIEAGNESPATSFRRLFGAQNIRPKRLCEVRHTITKFRITTEVFELKQPVDADCKSFLPSDLGDLPLVSAHRKALERLGYLRG